jgi:glyceraldehyde 3-phosphate dehydrogenase
MKVVSNASCAHTIASRLWPRLFMTNSAFVEGLMTTVHATSPPPRRTVDGHLREGLARRPRRGFFQTSSPAPPARVKAVGKVIPSLNGKLTGMAFRVPTADVSVVDLTCRLEKAASYDEIKAAMKAASESKEWAGIIGYTEDAVVSSDFITDPRTSILRMPARDQA